MNFQVIYIEACEAGSMFQGLLPNNWDIYATTAANAEENSYGTYCPDDYPSAPSEYDTCLGDTYSVAWLEDRYCYTFTPFIFIYLIFRVIRHTNGLSLCVLFAVKCMIFALKP